MKLQRRKQIDYQCPTSKHSELNYEFAYELGAEIMKENMQRKDQYMKNEKLRNQNHQNSSNRMETGQQLIQTRDQSKKNNQKNLRNQSSNKEQNSFNRVEFSNNETMRPLREEYYASQEYEPMDEHEDFLIEKQNQNNDKNFRKR